MINEKEKQARAFFKSQREAVLSTHSQELPGYPFGSLTPYCCLPSGDVVILISGLAQHTQNIKLNSKVCLTTHDHLDHIQAGRRLTLIGDAAEITDEKEALKVRSRYLEFFPEAKAYFQTHDFSFYKISPVRIRHIGGFGQIFWIEKEAWRSSPQSWIAGEVSALQHMNKDHQDFLQQAAQQYFNQVSHEMDQHQVMAIDWDGFYLKKTSQERNQQVFIPFLQEMKTEDEMRKSFADLGKHFRK